MDSAKPKNPHAVAMVNMRWSKKSKEERIAYSKMMNEAKKKKKVDSLNKRDKFPHGRSSDNL